MPMVEVTLTVDVWYEIANLDDPNFVFLQLDSSDTVICAFEADEPAALSETGIVLSDGVNSLPIPLNKKAWIKLLSGTGTIVYSQFGGVLFDESKSITGWYGGSGGSDEGVEQSPIVSAGFDDSQADLYAYAAFIESFAAGVDPADTVDSAILFLQLGKLYSGATLRLYGIAENASIFASITTWTELTGDPTITTEFIDFTVDSTGSVALDIADLLTELQAVSGWSTFSPLQFRLETTGSAISGVDATVSVAVGQRATAAYLQLS